MKSTYNKTTWIDGKTPVNASNLNNIENAIGKIFTNALTASELKPGEGINMNLTSSGEVEISTDDSYVASQTVSRIEIITEEPEDISTLDNGVMYFLVLSGKLKKIIFNGVAIYEME